MIKRDGNREVMMSCVGSVKGLYSVKEKGGSEDLVEVKKQVKPGVTHEVCLIILGKKVMIMDTKYSFLLHDLMRIK